MEPSPSHDEWGPSGEVMSNDACSTAEFDDASSFGPAAGTTTGTWQSPDQSGPFGDWQSRRRRKVFVGGVPQDVDNAQLWAFFAAFGAVERAWLQRHRRGERLSHRGFGFVIFRREGVVDQLLGEGSAGLLELRDGKRLEVKRALSSGQITGGGPQRGGGEEAVAPSPRRGVCGGKAAARPGGRRGGRGGTTRAGGSPTGHRHERGRSEQALRVADGRPGGPCCAPGLDWAAGEAPCRADGWLGGPCGAAFPDWVTPPAMPVPVPSPWSIGREGVEQPFRGAPGPVGAGSTAGLLHGAALAGAASAADKAQALLAHDEACRCLAALLLQAMPDHYED